VFLFDDICNTGTGFNQLADVLTRYGEAASVTGIFLGKNTDPEQE
jgi:predicted amidophosphoribosyltransferase